MIVGTVTLITILLTGGSMSTFIFDDIEKYVKSEVTEKGRKDAILSELKASKKEVKEYQKERRDRIKQLKETNLDRNADPEDFETLKNEFYEARVALDEKTAAKRVQLIKMIEDEEWFQIMDLAVADANSDKVKAFEKEQKGKLKDGFEKIKIAVETIVDSDNKTKALNAVADFETKYNSMESAINGRYPSDNVILVDKKSSAEQLMKVFNELSSIKRNAFWGLQDFHFALLDITTEEEWNKIMKEVNKIY